MSQHDLSRVEELFQAAADLPQGERSSFLDGACPGEPDLRSQVERLLARFDRDATFTGGGAGAERAAEVLGAAALTEAPGAVIGRYKLLQVIGEGGFGVVYMAEQQEPVVRKVALKIIKLGMDTREVVARFEAERQALAMMDHPSIARVLDGGATASGRPYFVMELVRGVAITDYCDRDELATPQRLELFVQVCHAVQHAHQKGVIHRDLKPSNVLVTLHDGHPVPKVIDFGVAKAMHTRLTEKTLFTRYEQFLGTPAYMSPEQAEMSALDVDTRTDIYALGVLLYELLTGTTPFDAQSLRRVSLGELQRIIREQEPPRPSVRISTSGDAAIARQRQLDVASLSRRLRGDLDWIVMKTLEKERSRRYATASELADDVRRHLRDEPVLAGPPGAAYRARKFLARNRAAVLSAAALGVVLIAGIIGTTLGMLQARRNEDLAKTRAVHAVQTLEFLDSVLALSNPEVTLDPQVSVRTLLEHTATRCSEAFEDQPWAEARIRSTIGRAWKVLGESALAEPHLRRAVAIVDEHMGEAPKAGLDQGVYDAGDFYATLWTLTNVCFHLERPDAFAMAQRARRVGLEHVASFHPDLAAALQRFVEGVDAGAWLVEKDAMAGVGERFEAAAALADARLAPGDRLWPIVADTFLTGGYEVWYTPHELLAERFFGKALEIQRRELPPDHPDIAASVNLLTNVLNRHGRGAEAEHLIRDSIEALRRVHGDGALPIAIAESTLGENLAAQGRYEEAEPILVRSHEALMERIGNEAKLAVTESIMRLVHLYDRWGRPEQATPYRSALARSCALGNNTFQWSITRMIFGPEYGDLCELLDTIEAQCGGISYVASPGTIEAPDVAPLLRELPALRSARLDATSPQAAALARLLLGWANALEPKRHVEARRILASEAVAILRHWPGERAIDLAEGWALLSSTSLARGDLTAAGPEAAEAWRLVQARPAEGTWWTASARVRIARSFLELGEYERAEALLLESHQILASQLGAMNGDSQTARRLLFDLYTAWGRPDRAREYGEAPAP